MVRGCGIGTGPKTDGIVPAIVSMVAMSPPVNAPIRFNIVPTASRRPHTQAAANTGGSAVWARSSTSTWASIGEFHSINDRASTGSVSPISSACPPRVRGAHSDTARIHPVNVSTSASMPDAYKLVHASRMATARYSHCAGLSPRTRGSAPGVAMTSCGANPISDTTPLGWLGVDSTIGTPRNSLASSIAVPAAPTLTTRMRSLWHVGHDHCTVAAPHQRHRIVPSANRSNGPVQRAHRTWRWHFEQLNASVMPSCGMDSSTGPVSKALDSIRTAVCGTRAPMVGSASRASSSRLSQRIHGDASLVTAGNACMGVLKPLTCVSPTCAASVSHWLCALRALAIATNTPLCDFARSRSTPRALAYGIMPSASW